MASSTMLFICAFCFVPHEYDLHARVNHISDINASPTTNLVVDNFLTSFYLSMKIEILSKFNLAGYCYLSWTIKF